MLSEFKGIGSFTEAAISFDMLPERVRPSLSDKECFNKLQMLLEFLRDNSLKLNPFDKYGYVNVSFKDIAYFDLVKSMQFEFEYEIILNGDYEFGIVRMYF